VTAIQLLFVAIIVGLISGAAGVFIATSSNIRLAERLRLINERTERADRLQASLETVYIGLRQANFSLLKARECLVRDERSESDKAFSELLNASQRLVSDLIYRATVLPLETPPEIRLLILKAVEELQREGHALHQPPGRMPNTDIRSASHDVQATIDKLSIVVNAHLRTMRGE